MQMDMPRKKLRTYGQLLLFLLIAGSEMTWAAQDEGYRSIVFVPKRKILVGVSEDYRTWASNMQLWSVENRKLEYTIDFSPRERARVIAVRPDGELMAVVFWILPEKGEKYGHTSIRCYSLSERKWAWKNDWQSKFDMAREVRFSPDGLRVIVIGYKNILFYDAKTGRKLDIIDEPLKDYPELPLSIRGSFVSPSGRYIVVWQEKPLPGHALLARLMANKWVTVWDLQTKKRVARWKKPKYENFCATFTQDEQNILFGSRGHIDIWSVKEQKMIREWRLADFLAVDSLKFSEDYHYLAVYGTIWNFDIMIWDFTEGKEVHHFRDVGCADGPYPMTFFDGSRSFAFARKDQLCVYDTQTWKEKWCSLDEKGVSP